MFNTNATDSVAGAYVDKDTGTSTPGTKLEAADRNIIQEEIANAVIAGGQVLDPTGVKRQQLAEAITVGGLVSISAEDSGSANAYIVTSVSGTAKQPTLYAEIDGAIVLFDVNVVNTGVSTLNFAGLGVKSFVNIDGSVLVAGQVDGSVIARWSNGDDRWELVFSTEQVAAGVQSVSGAGINNTDPVNPVTKVSDSLTLNDSNTLASSKAITLANTWVANDPRAKTALNATGSAPIFAERAWVNFNGTGVVAIRASGNVSSIIDIAAGLYHINCIAAMPDIDFVPHGTATSDNISNPVVYEAGTYGQYRTTTGCRMQVVTSSSAAVTDSQSVSISILR